MIKNKKNVFIFLNIVEAIYIFYMFNFFKTRYSVHFQWENTTQQYSFLKHPIQTGKYESKICWVFTSHLDSLKNLLLCLFS